MASERILFVDDDPVSRRSFARAMRQNGFIVDLAQDGDEAWELATHFPYAVIATDLRMPGMDGMMLIDQLQELQPDTVCLLVTGCSEQEWYDSKILDEANVDVIQKPWKGDQLAAALHKALCEYRARTRKVLDSEPPPESVTQTIALIGFPAPQRHLIEELLEGGYRCTAVDEAAELAAISRLGCVLIGECASGARELRTLRLAVPEAQLVVLGPRANPKSATEAIRRGADDWLPVDNLAREDLVRAVMVAIARGPQTRPDYASGGLAGKGPGPLKERLRQAVSRARRFSTGAGLLLVDVDRFGDIEQSMGMQAADELLTQISRRLHECIRESDAIARLRRDEFALVLEDLVDGSTLEVPARRVLNAFATPFQIRDSELMVTASIGGAVFPEHGPGAEEMSVRAERALERAKSEGRNRYRLLSDVPVGLDGAEPIPSDSAYLG